MGNLLGSARADRSRVDMPDTVEALQRPDTAERTPALEADKQPPAVHKVTDRQVPALDTGGVCKRAFQRPCRALQASA
jgi:hypothetical protein